MSERELLPCPFCGAHVRMREGAFAPQEWWVICDNCDTEGSPGSTVDDAAARWNRRAPDPEREALEAERDAYKARTEALEALCACYRVGKSPGERLWKKLESSRDALSALDAARREAQP